MIYKKYLNEGFHTSMVIHHYSLRTSSGIPIKTTIMSATTKWVISKLTLDFLRLDRTRDTNTDTFPTAPTTNNALYIPTTNPWSELGTVSDTVSFKFRLTSVLKYSQNFWLSSDVSEDTFSIFKSEFYN